MKLTKDEVVILKRCKKGSIAYNDFVYPEEGIVEASDWKDTKECGNGLHGWTLGFEDYFDNELKGNFIVLLVNKKDGYVELDDKVKFKKGKVLLNTPDIEKAHSLMKEFYPNIKLHWSTATQGDRSTATQGYCSTATQGDYSTATQGRSSTATQGDYSTATQGRSSTATQGYGSTAKQGGSSTATQGRSSTATQGDYSTATQGDRSTATQSYCSTATQGYGSTAKQGGSSTATQGRSSTATQGDYSTAKQGYCSISHIFGTDYIYRNLSKLCAIVMFYDEKMYIFRGDKDFSPNETIKIVDNKIKFRYFSTPEKITSLKEHEVFVFGSNVKGNHAGGAAKTALEKFGAIQNIGEGLQGQSYAFPTLDENMNFVSDEAFKESVNKLYKCASENTTKIFLLTKVGCGIAGGDENKIKTFFKNAPANIVLPKEWY